MVYKQSRVDSLVWAYRDVGYIYADLNPLENYSTPELTYMYITMEGNYESLRMEDFGLSEEDLDTEFFTGGYFEPKRAKLRQLLNMLERTYCGRMGAEILHIQNKPMRRWLIEKIETPGGLREWTQQEKIRFQKDLIKAEELERFIQSNFIGQKRFSLEGGEVLIPALRYLFDTAAQRGVHEVVLGMAHRGRINVFTNALRKPAFETFAGFIENYKPHTYGGSGDVKYHLGHSFDYDSGDGNTIHISLVANPSHLESVDPVVEGKSRGIQRRRRDRNRKKVMPVLIHGDAAFSGQGVVAETFNLSQLKGYKTGGTVHIILNNQIGFTTASRDARSTFFATDIAKTMPVPILHVNGDDPEAVLRAIDLAMRWRHKFGYDVVVDILVYRRLGHNEADEPSFTHPIMYNLIKNHDSVRSLYGRRLAESGDYSEDDQKAFSDKYKNVLKNELDKAKGGEKPNLNDAYEVGEWKQFQRQYSHEPVETGVDRSILDEIAKTLVTVPNEFGIHPKLKRFIKDRRQKLESGEGLDWALAESLAWGSLLREGYPIRLSGEDSSRGTFSQRHTVWWDASAEVPQTYTPLKNISENQGTFSVYDSPLSEFAVLGFDYGYSLAQPNILVMWEAQFGDFVNGGQVIIDQFISAGETKWFRSSGLVMLLPHGYEGQGPEHSSAHLERFLTLCAEDNLQVVNPTTPAQYFHLLRRQMKQPFRKPLITMTPKSLLRHKRCVSSLDDLTQGHYRTVIADPGDPEEVSRVIICSGKVYYDLLERREKTEANWVTLVRLEQIYPFPWDELRNTVGRYTDDAEVIWCQEESQNRGAFGFVRGRLDEILQPTGRRVRYVGRPASASPAAGSHKQHLEELENFLSEAIPEGNPSTAQ
jgi:2-oxoglutarate dehydrogenase E1 component